jgi:pyruvate dehydrogenase E1 component beta subunit
VAETINATLADLMEQDPRVVLLGEDIGQAVGMAMSGLVPICEIQFDGFAYVAANQLTTQAARVGHRWNGQITPSMVVRIPSGGGIRGVEHHSESNEGLFARAPGISVAYPSTAQDADQILRYAVGSGSPVVIYEPIRLYWKRTQVQDAEPARAPTAARICRRGSDLTVATFGGAVPVVLQAARALSPQVDVEVVDLRWVAPLDTDPILESVARTGRLLIVHEAPKFAGMGAEVAAAVAEDGFGTLKAPIRRLAPGRTEYPPADRENDYLISAEQITDEVLVMMK